MTLSTWLALAAICVLGAMSPGPSLAVVVRHTVSGSRAHGVVTAFAHSAGIGIYALLTSFGLAVLIVGNSLLYQSFAIAGAGYLLWLGYGALRSGGALDASAQRSAPSRVRVAARDGFAISLLNPKIAIFFLALFSQFVRPGMGMGSHLLMGVTAMLIDGCWYALVAVALSRDGMLDVLRRHGRWIDYATGAVLIVLAVVTLGELLFVTLPQ